MAVFNYKVVDRDGKNKKGTIEAPNRDGALRLSAEQDRECNPIACPNLSDRAI